FCGTWHVCHVRHFTDTDVHIKCVIVAVTTRRTCPISPPPLPPSPKKIKIKQMVTTDTQQQPPPPADLYHYLSIVPSYFAYDLTDSAKKDILRNCYNAFWRNDQQVFRFLFPDGFDEALLSIDATEASADAELVDALSGSSAVQNAVLDNDENLPEYSETHRGKPCGHVLRKGEGVYRCRNCGLDDTCVFCARCFRATNHEGHDVSFTISIGAGCCDCGDSEAWRVPVHCKYHTADAHSSPGQSPGLPNLPTELHSSIRSTIATVLDFVLETFAASPSTIAPPASRQAVELEARQTALMTDRGPMLEEGREKYACVLWNDENHSFVQVIEVVTEGSGCTESEAELIAKQVDTHVGDAGREIIEMSDDIDRLLNIARVVSRVGLAVTVRSARDTFREHVSGMLLLWLKELTCGKLRLFPHFGDGVTVLRDILCAELCSEWRRGVSSAAANRGPRHDDPEDEEMAYTDEETAGDDVVMEERREEEEAASEGIVELDADVDITEAEWDVVRGAEEDDTETWPGVWEERQRTSALQYEDFRKKLRLDWLMLVDRRLWKEVRICMRDMFIGALIIKQEYKKIFAIRFARNYLKLADSFLFKDREPEHTVFLLSVQVFTVPRLAALLVNHYNFFGTLCSSLRNLFTYDTVIPSTPRSHLRRPINVEVGAGFKNRRYFQLFHDLRFVLSSESVKQSISRHPRYLAQYLDFVAAFQGMDVQVRQTDQHVEYESETWANAFNATVQLVKSCRQFAECFGDNPAVLGFVIRRLMKKLNDWATRRPEEADARGTDAEGGSEHEFQLVETPHAGAHRIIKFEVSAQPVSFHHPLHWLLAELLEHIEGLEDQVLREAGLGSFKHMAMGFDVTIEDIDALVTNNREKVLAILDYPLRAVVLLAQMRAGVWVRNGYSARSQAHHYREVSVREYTYDADLLILQTGLVLLDMDLFLLTILDRFQLLGWFSGKTHKVYDTAQTVYMIEELLDVLIVCANERAILTGVTLEDRIRREIIHGLCLSPLAYSELAKRIPERLCENPKYDQLLSELANFRAPEGLHDHGVYELKEQYYDDVDPYFFHYTRNNRAEAEQVLKSRWKKHGDSRTFLVPRPLPITKGPFVKLGNVLHARVMIQVITHALWNVKGDRKMNNDLIIDEALYLIMLALVDENNDYTPKASKGKGKQKETSASPAMLDLAEQADGTPGFVHHATFDDYAVAGELEREHVTLLKVLLRYLDDEHWKEIHDKLEWIVGRIYELGSTVAKVAVDEFRWRKANPSLVVNPAEPAADSSGMTEAERKKQLAKESKEKMLAMFAQAREKFEENNGDLEDTDDDDEEELLMERETEAEGRADDGVMEQLLKETRNIWRFPTGTCIVCQEETDQRELYGMLCLVQPSSMLRLTPLKDGGVEFLKEVLGTPETLDVTVPLAHITKGFQPNSHVRGPYISTCGHLMHAHCFDTYAKSLEARQQAYPSRNHPENLEQREFLCPLCKSLGNIMLPIQWKTKMETFPGVLVESGVDDFQRWLESGVDAAAARLQMDAGARSDPGMPERRSNSILANAAGAFSQFVRRPFGSGSTDRRDTMPGSLANAEPEYVRFELTRPEGSADEQDDTAIVPLVGGEPLVISLDAPRTMEIYDRITEVLRMVCDQLWTQEDRTLRETSAIKHVDLLWEAFGYTISCVEIAHRGMGGTGEFGEIAGRGTLVDTIPEATLTLLRMLSETTMTYYSIVAMGTGMEWARKLRQLTVERLRQLFYDNMAMRQLDIGPQNLFFAAIRNRKLKPLLKDDPFHVLVECSMYMAPTLGFKTHHLMRLMYLAEVVKTTIALVQALGSDIDQADRNVLQTARASLLQQQYPMDMESVEALHEFIESVVLGLNLPVHIVARFLDVSGDQLFARLLRAYLLPFLRKCTIFLHARFGVTPQPGAEGGISRDGNEFDRLREFLRLPSFDELFISSSHRTPNAFGPVIAGWLHHLRDHAASLTEDIAELESESALSTSVSLGPVRIPLNHPAIFSLIELPQRLETLFEESLRRLCRKCGQVPHEPAMCLMCGTFVCYQSFCCTENDMGECNQHRVRYVSQFLDSTLQLTYLCVTRPSSCGGEVGIYFVVKKCIILLLYKDRGSFVNPPYLDAHGEVDIHFK
ncbi:hypothetical protein BC936DRAFT_145224, partial [Jimgerdemannia flammicorona]